MNDDAINRLALRAIVAMVVVVMLVVGAGFVLDRISAPAAVGGAADVTALTVPAVAGIALEPQPSDSPGTSTTSSITTTTVVPVAAVTSATASSPSAPPDTAPANESSSVTTVTTTGLQVAPTTVVAAPATTQPPPPPTTSPSTTTTTRLATTTTAAPTTTTTSTTTTTTVQPTTTTTSTTTTTTTLPPTTTTTLPPTTTTTSTTTTTVPLPGIFLRKFEGHDHGDAGDWEAHVKVEIRDENDEKAGFATVLIRWTGGETGEVLLEAKKDGKVDVKFGSFSTSPLTFSVDGVWLDGYVYMPSLDQKPSTIVIEGP